MARFEICKIVPDVWVILWKQIVPTSLGLMEYAQLRNYSNIGQIGAAVVTAEVLDAVVCSLPNHYQASEV